MMTKMGKVEIWEETTENPISLIGKAAGICWGAYIGDADGNHRRGIDCIKSNHGRTLEIPQIYMTLDGYSAKCIREFYTHIGGAPTRLQASTRYIDYSKNLEVVTPKSIQNNPEALKIWDDAMMNIAPEIQKLKSLGIPNEDATNILPLAYGTKVVVRTNLRNLIDMCHQRLCSRAYWEFRELMKDILFALECHSDEWEEIIYDLKVFKPKCEVIGYCPEKKGCGRMNNRVDEKK